MNTGMRTGVVVHRGKLANHAHDSALSLQLRCLCQWVSGQSFESLSSVQSACVSGLLCCCVVVVLALIFHARTQHARNGSAVSLGKEWRVDSASPFPYRHAKTKGLNKKSTFRVRSKSIFFFERALFPSFFFFFFCSSCSPLLPYCLLNLSLSLACPWPTLPPPLLLILAGSP